MNEISIRNALTRKNILLTGASGFLGKVWLCMILDRVPEIGKIYVLLRSKDGLTPKQRLEKIINSSPAFSILHETYGNRLEPFLAEHLRAVEGDVSLPHFGLNEPSMLQSCGNIDLILNCAGLTDFYPDLRAAFQANIQGPLHALQLAHTLGSALLHVSTAYVTGSRDGEIEEDVAFSYCPSGKSFDASQEYREVKKLVSSPSERSWVDLAQERANLWGWSNAYTYTKSLAESLIVDQAEDVPFTLFRPTIVESALRFPFPGWNEGITTCAPLSYLASQWVRVFPMKPNYLLDLIPVDLVCEGLTVAAGALLSGKAKRVYQCGTSHLNPLSQRFALEMMNLNHREYFQANGKGVFEKLYLSRFHPVVVDEKSFFTATNLKKLTNIALDLAALASPYLPSLVQRPLEMGRKTLKKIKWELIKAERILETFKPFLLLYDYVFKTENLKSHAVQEMEFQFRPEEISWGDYIVNIHEPGLRKWCYPLIEGKPVEEYQPRRACVLPSDKTLEKKPAADGLRPTGRESDVLNETNTFF